jgi:hypothetical protein
LAAAAFFAGAFLAGAAFFAGAFLAGAAFFAGAFFAGAAFFADALFLAEDFFAGAVFFVERDTARRAAVAAFPAKDVRVLRAICLLAFLWPRPLPGSHGLPGRVAVARGSLKQAR